MLSFYDQASNFKEVTKAPRISHHVSLVARAEVVAIGVEKEPQHFLAFVVDGELESETFSLHGFLRA